MRQIRQAEDRQFLKVHKCVALSIGMCSPQWLRRALFAMQGRMGADKVKPQAKLKVLDRIHLGGKRSLAVVSLDGQRYLVAMGGDAVPTLTALPSSREQKPFQETPVMRSHRLYKTVRKAAQG